MSVLYNDFLYISILGFCRCPTSHSLSLGFLSIINEIKPSFYAISSQHFSFQPRSFQISIFFVIMKCPYHLTFCFCSTDYRDVSMHMRSLIISFFIWSCNVCPQRRQKFIPQHTVAICFTFACLYPHTHVVIFNSFFRPLFLFLS